MHGCIGGGVRNGSGEGGNRNVDKKGMGIKRVSETGIKRVSETGIKRVSEMGIKSVSETGKILV